MRSLTVCVCLFALTVCLEAKAQQGPRLGLPVPPPPGAAPIPDPFLPPLTPPPLKVELGEPAPIPQVEQPEFVRTLRLQRGVTKLHWVSITVTQRDEIQKTVRGLLHQPTYSQIFTWPVNDGHFEELQMGPNGEAGRYNVLIAVSPDDRKAILGVYEGGEMLPLEQPQQEVMTPEPVLTPIPQRKSAPNMEPVRPRTQQGPTLAPTPVLPQGNTKQGEGTKEAPRKALPSGPIAIDGFLRKA